MSGEYYILEEIVDQDSDTNIEAPQCFQNGDKVIAESTRSGKESKLHDIEKQLELAESRCSCLKNQLDYMKHLYGVKKSDSKTNKCVTTSRISKLKKHYENKTAIDVKITETAKSPEVRVNQTTQVNLCEELQTNNQDVVMNNTILMSMQSQPEKPNKLDEPSVTKLPRKKDAATLNRDEKRITVKIPKTATDSNFSAMNMSRASRRSMRKSQSAVRTVKRKKSQLSQPKTQATVTKKISELSAHKLVEIYHNTAAKGSDSDDSNGGNKKTKRKPMTESDRVHTDVPPLKINIKNQIEGVSQKFASCHDSIRDNQYCNISSSKQMPVPSKDCSAYSKNYTLPTIASRLKQVAKNYLSTYNFKAIPFCAAIATTPSHNIGINIQQVMNIIKTRQPIQGLSPTLTHNIVLAANKLNCTPLSTFISSIASRADYSASKQMCPLSHTLVNYHQLEEMAKTVPDEVINEENEDANDTEPAAETTTITGPTGEFQIQNQQRLLWSMETNNNMCTCIPQNGLELQQVVTKYQSNHTIYTNSQISGTSTRRTFKRTASRNSRLGIGDARNGKQMKTISEQVIRHADTPTPLQGKERNLKEVLTNLHNEFEVLNKKYDAFVAKADEKGDDEEYIKELTKLEHELNNKEEEITMVMALYKEVLALKDQVKSLKQQTKVVASKDNISKFQDYNNPRAAFHLTKLLRQIQHYQMHYKKTA